MKRQLHNAFSALAALAALLAVAAAQAAPAARPAERGHAAAPKAAPSIREPAAVAAIAKQIDVAETQLDAISLHAHAKRLSDTDLREALAAIPPIQAKLASALDGLNPRLNSADERLAQLGPPPGAGQPPEDPETAQTRQRILNFRRSVDIEVKQARLLSTVAQQLTNYVEDRRRSLFAQRLRVHGPSVLDPVLWMDFGREAAADTDKLAGIVGDETALLVASYGSPGAVLWGLGAALTALLAIAARILLNRWGESRLSRSSAPGRDVGALAAVWWLAVAGVTPLLAGLAIQGALADAGASTPIFDQLLALLWKAIVYGALIEAAARALLAPGRPNWRVAPLPAGAGDHFAFYPGLIGASVALAGFVTGLDGVVGFGDASNQATGYLAVVLQIAVIVLGLSQIGRARVAQADSTMDGSGAASRSLWTIVAVVAWVTLGAAGAAILTGYLALATFLVRELVWAAAIIAVIYLLMRGVDAGIAWLLSPARPLGRAIRISIGLSARGLDQLAELISGLVRLGLVLGGWAGILAPLGADAQDVFGRITSTNLVLKLGQVTISPGAIAGALLVFGIGLAATQVLRGWLEARYLPKTRLDMGVRTSLASVVTYVGIFIVVMLTCVDLGLSLDRIALLASALTVGIGFGLQAVIGNFVSGLILLAERPVKVGDWIAIGELEGDVRRISVRATEIEMGDRSRLIVPNSELVSKMVRNVTHGGSVGQVKIVLSLTADCDPLAVRDLLLKRLGECPGALKDPAPAVYMTDVKDAAMQFTAFVYLPSPRLAFKAKSDLLFQIVPDLKAAGMTLASSSPVVRVDLTDRPAGARLAAE